MAPEERAGSMKKLWKFQEAFSILPSGWLTEAEAAELWTASLCTGDILEIGTYRGRSATLLACSLARHNYVGITPTLTLCDSYDDGHHFGGGDELTPEQAIDSVIEGLRLSGIDMQFVDLARMSEQELSAKWPADKKLGLLYMDGDHSFEGTFGVIERWYRRVYQHGRMLFHDYADAGGGLEVKRAVELGCERGWIELLKVTERMAVCRCL